MPKICHFLCILLILFFCHTQPANATAKTIQQVCPRQPKINIDFPIPQVKYISNLTPKQFCAKLGQQECLTQKGFTFCIKGVTVPPTINSLQLILKAQTIMYKKKTYACPTSVDIVVKYQEPFINVYLSNEYKKSSCAYRVIKEHENYHVEIFKQSIPFYKPQIQTFLIQEIGQLPVYSPKNDEEMQNIANQYVHTLVQKLHPVQEYINKTINAKNSAIDTPESYLAQQKQCKKW